MKGLLFLLLALPGLVLAQGKNLTLDVKGEVAIDPQGVVYDYRIDTMLTPEVKQLVDRSVRKWTFEPVVRNGMPVHAKSNMYLILAAAHVEQGYQLRVEKVRFGGSRKPKTMMPPRYPREAQLASLSATVLVALRIDEKGNVMDAAAAQSSLDGVRGNDKVIEKWRKRFDTVAVEAARQWKFEPADMASGEAGDTTQLVPISFRIGENPISDGWRYAEAGSARPIPWLPSDKQQYDASGLKSGESIALDNTFRLKTDIVGKAL